MAATTWSDGDVPDHTDLADIAGGVVEVYDTADARDDATPASVPGVICWVIEEQALYGYTSTGWQQVSGLAERRYEVAYPLSATDLSWRPRAATLRDHYLARVRHLDSVIGTPGRGDVWALTGGEMASHTGHVIDTAATSHTLTIDDAREVAHYQIADPSDLPDGYLLADAGSAVEVIADDGWQTLILAGVASWRVPRDIRAQILICGAGGWGGTGGAVGASGSGSRLVAGGGGGGGAGGLTSIITDLPAGGLLTVRCGGRHTDRQIAGRPVVLDDELSRGVSITYRDGITPDVSAVGSACWLDGRPLGRSGGGGRGGSVASHIPSAWLRGTGSGGGGSPDLSQGTPSQAPTALRSGLSNSGGPAFAGAVLDGRLKLEVSGAGGGGAAGRGESNSAYILTSSTGLELTLSARSVAGGDGGDGITTGWSGVPELCRGGDGGWARNEPRSSEIVDATRQWGAGGRGGGYYLTDSSSPVAGGESLAHGVAPHLPGLGAVLIRYRTDDGEFAETSIDG